MFGEHNSRASSLKEKVPDIFLMCYVYVCHSAHLCASHSCEILPLQLKNFFVMCTNTFATVPNENVATYTNMWGSQILALKVKVKILSPYIKV